MVLDEDTDWEEVAELVTESYRLCAPQKAEAPAGTIRTCGP